jgi:hypothetical protein
MKKIIGIVLLLLGFGGAFMAYDSYSMAREAAMRIEMNVDKDLAYNQFDYIYKDEKNQHLAIYSSVAVVCFIVGSLLILRPKKK